MLPEIGNPLQQELEGSAVGEWHTEESEPGTQCQFNPLTNTTKQPSLLADDESQFSREEFTYISFLHSSDHALAVENPKILHPLGYSDVHSYIPN